MNFLKFDVSKIDFSKLNINAIKNIKVISVIFLIVIFILDLVLVLPLTKKIHEAQKQQSVDSDETMAASKLLFKESQVIKRQLYPIEKVEDLFDEIDGIAKEMEIDIKINNSLGNYKDKSPGFSRKIMRIEFNGSFKQLGLFLERLYGMKHAILDMDNMNVSRNPKDPATVEAKISLILFTTLDAENP